MFVYKMHSTFRQTFAYILLSKFNCHRSFDFVYKMYTKVCQNMGYNLYTFCIHQLYTSCTVFVYKMYTQFPCALKMMKNAFYFMSKAIFVLKIFKFSF